MSATETAPLQILLHSKFLGDWILRQTPDGSGVWGNCQFIVNGPPGDYDRIFIYDTMAGPVQATCPPDGTFMLVGEPPELKDYPLPFLAQFGNVVSPDTNTPHPNLIDSQTAQPWLAGIGQYVDAPNKAIMTLEDHRAARPEKTGLISVIASFRNTTNGHRARIALVEALKKKFGDQVAVMGRDAIPFTEKWSAVAPFKYHVALENSRFPNYFTEKLADAYLGDAFPFYWGCPNAEHYFNPEGFRRINVYDPERTVETIAAAIDEGLYEKTQAIRDADRVRLMDEYNIFALMARLAERPVKTAPQALTLQPESEFRDSELRKLRKRLKRAVPRSLRPKRWKV